MSGHPSDHTVYSGGDISRLDRSLASGVAWTAAAKWSTQVLSWASLIAIAHLLSPSDFGLVGMAAIYLGLITIISEFGVGTAVLTLRDLTNEQVAQLNSVSVIFGLAGFGISCAIAGPLGKFFRAPKLPIVVIAMSATLWKRFTIPIGFISCQPYWTLP